MDPNETLASIRNSVKALRGEKLDRDDEIAHLYGVVELFEALDEWLTKGGWSPGEWSKAWPSRTTTRPRAHRRPLLVPPEPLGGPVPGVGGSHLPEGEH